MDGPGMGPVCFLLWLILACIIPVHGDVIVLNTITNQTFTFTSAPASFGDFRNAVPGGLVTVLPVTACDENITRPPFQKNMSFIALVSRGDCQFIKKIINVQQAGFVGAIVVNYRGVQLLVMGGVDSNIKIPSVLVSYTTGLALLDFLYLMNPNYTVSMNGNYNEFSWHSYLYPFIIVVGVCLMLMGVFMIIRYFRERRRVSRRRLPAVDLRRIPTIKFKKGETSRYDTCAICLDDYEDGDKLRVLPCEHAYHCQCIDKWLLSRSRACPVCKTKVQRNPDDDDDDEADSPGPQRRSRRPNNRTATAAGAGSATAAVADIEAANDDTSDSDDSYDEGDERVPFVRSLDRVGGQYGSSGNSPPSHASSPNSVDLVPRHTNGACDDALPPVTIATSLGSTSAEETLNLDGRVTDDSTV